VSSLILWLLRRFQYVRQLEQKIAVLTAQLEEKRVEEQQAESAARPIKAFRLKLGWHEIAEREAAKRNLKEQRVERLAKELERQ
jgi:hypothetical protein